MFPRLDNALVPPMHPAATLSRNFVEPQCADVGRHFDGGVVMPSTIGPPFGDRDDAKLLAAESSCAKEGAIQQLKKEGKRTPALLLVEPDPCAILSLPRLLEREGYVAK
jgi:hypothetical protein